MSPFLRHFALVEGQSRHCTLLPQNCTTLPSRPPIFKGCNIVGFQNNAITDKSGYALLGFQFEGTGKTFTLQDIVPADKGMTGPGYGTTTPEGKDWTEIAPQIYIRDEEGAYSRIRYYICDAYESEPGSGNYDLPGWVDGLANPDEDEVDLGKGYWILDTYNASSVWTVAGQVHGKTSFQDTYATDYTLAANPFPIAFNPNDLTWSGLTGPAYGTTTPEGKDWTEIAPQIFVRDAEGAYSVIRYYISDAFESVPGSGNYDIPGWVDGLANPVEEDIVPAGAGFWFLNNYSGTDTDVTYTR